MTNKASKRTTEGSRPGKRGRPLGSRNKSKGLIGRELATKLIRNMEHQLSPEQFAYLQGVVRDGKPIETKQEIDTLLALLARNLYPALIHEMMPEDEGGLGGVYRKDVTDRLKLVREFLTLRSQIDHRESKDDEQVGNDIITITSKRGLNIERLGVLVGSRTDSVGGDFDRIGRSADEVGAVPDTVSERPLLVSHSEQGSPDRVLDGSEPRDSARSDDAPEVQE